MDRSICFAWMHNNTCLCNSFAHAGMRLKTVANQLYSSLCKAHTHLNLFIIFHWFWKQQTNLVLIEFNLSSSISLVGRCWRNPFLSSAFRGTITVSLRSIHSLPTKQIMPIINHSTASMCRYASTNWHTALVSCSTMRFHSEKGCVLLLPVS